MQRQMQRGRKIRELGLAFLALTLGILLLSGPALATTDKYWIADNGTWSTATNWSPSGVPVAGDNVYLTQSGDISNKTVTYRNTVSPAPVLNSLTIDATGTKNMSLTQTTYAHPLASLYEYIGYNGKGYHGQSLGTNNISNDLYLGYLLGSSGTYRLSGGSLSASSQYAGYLGSGTFNQTGGSNTVGNDLYVGYGAGSTGTYTLSGGTLSASSQYVGNYGSGTLAQSGGSNNASSGLYMGYGTGSTGTYTLSGGSLSAAYQYLGYTGSGTFTQSAGTNTVSNSLYLGYSGAASNGTYTLSGGSLSASNQYVGYMAGATGTFTQTGGSNTVGGTLYLGSSTDTTGAYTLSGASSSLSAGNVYLGQGTNSIANFTQTDAATNIAGSLSVGTGFNSLSSFTLNSGTLSAFSEYVGTSYMTNASFTQTGGTNTTQSLDIGYGGGPGTGSAYYGLLGGTLNVANTVNLNQGGTLGINTPGGAVLNFQTFNQMGGTVNGGILTNNWGSQYNYSGGAFNARLVNMGYANFNADFHATDGIDNQWRISANDRNFTLDGYGLNNRGIFELYGGSIGGSGPLVNSGTMTLNGDIAGSGNFTNFGYFSISDWVRLVKTGTHVNYGQIAFGSDYQSGGGVLVLSGNTLTNRGLINLSSNYYMGSPIFIEGGTLTNDVGGIIQGAGNITSNFSNAGLLSVAGTMQIYKDFTNTGIIQLGYSSSGGSGGSILMGGQTSGSPSGAITNLGKITGAGIVNNNINSNTGVIENLGYSGSLVLNGSVANNAGGLITANDGGGVIVNQGLAVNGGRISLNGGTFDNNGHAMTNTNAGQIAGYGAFRTGGAGLLNYGKINLTGNLGQTTVVNGAVNNGTEADHATARMDLSSYTYFTDLVTNWGTVKTYGVGTDLGKATLTFAGGYAEHGDYFSDPMWQKIDTNLTVYETGALVGSKGDVWEVGGNFINYSTKNTTWSTAEADLIFSSLGSGTQHQLYLTGTDRGASRQGYINNFAWGELNISGQGITLVDGNGDNSSTAFYVGLLLGATIEGGKATNIDGNGFNLYYDPFLTGNQYLGGGTFALLDGGFLAPIMESAPLTQTPLPPTVWMLLSGLAGLGLLKRRKVTKN